MATVKQRLSKKEKGFVKEYVKTGNGTEAALRVYEIDPTKKNPENTAASIASENLRKPHIEKAIADRLPDDLLEERHLELLNKRDTVTIQNEDKTYQKIDLGPETRAVSKGLDMAYKIKGSYAPEKTLNVNIEVDANPEIKELTEKLNQLYGGNTEESQSITHLPREK